MSIDYSRWAERYEHELDRAVDFIGLPHEFFTRAKADELLGLVRKHLGPPQDLDALDAGCGIGLTDRFLVDSFGALTGTDLSPEAVAAAAARNPGVRYEVAAEDRLPFPDESFDVSFTICVLQTIEPVHRAGFVDELARVTRPGGLVIAFEHNPWHPLTRLAVRRTELGSGVSMLSSAGLVALLAGGGLAVLDRGHILALPSRRKPVLAAERILRRIPVGAQHYAATRRKAPPSYTPAVVSGT